MHFALAVVIGATSLSAQQRPTPLLAHSLKHAYATVAPQPAKPPSTNVRSQRAYTGAKYGALIVGVASLVLVNTSLHAENRVRLQLAVGAGFVGGTLGAIAGTVISAAWPVREQRVEPSGPQDTTADTGAPRCCAG